MKRTPKAAFFIVAVLILLLCFTSIFGVYTRFGDRTDTVIRSLFDIRWGVDIQGGVEARFGPADKNVKPTEDQVEIQMKNPWWSLQKQNIFYFVYLFLFIYSCGHTMW